MRIRFRILLACLSLASVTIALGLFVLEGQRELGRLALRIYDDAVMSISYARSAETRFAELRGKLAISDQAGAAAAPRETSERQALLAVARGQSGPGSSRDVGTSTDATRENHRLSRAEVDKAVATIVDDLDVAIERAMSDEGRKSARALRESVVAVAAGWPGVISVRQIDAITGAFDQLVEHYSADGLQLRASAEDLVARGTRSTISAIGASVAIAIFITWVLSIAIVPAIQKAVKFAEDIADGRLDGEIALPRRRGKSETAALLVALSRMQAAIRESLDRSERLRAEKTEFEQNQARLRKDEMRRFVDDFERAVGDIIDTVSAASSELESSAGVLTTTADRSRHLAAMVDTASGEATANVRAVASAAEKMASSADLVSRQAQASAKIASEAVRQAHGTNERVSALSKAAARIGDVVELITKVAGSDQSAGLERHHRGGAGRRRRTWLCRGRLRGQGAGATDRQGDRGNQPADRQHSGRDRRVRSRRSRRSVVRSGRCRTLPRRSRPRSRSRAPPTGTSPRTCGSRPSAPSKSRPTFPTCSAARSRPAAHPGRCCPRRGRWRPKAID